MTKKQAEKKLDYLIDKCYDYFNESILEIIDTLYEYKPKVKRDYISKRTIKKKIEKYNTYGEQPYADETINNIVISELKELLGEWKYE